MHQLSSSNLCYILDCSKIRTFTAIHVVCSLNLGAEWWAQDFRKSLPFLGWIPIPFLSGMYSWDYEMTSPFYANTALLFPLCLIGMIFDCKHISISVLFATMRYLSLFARSAMLTASHNYYCNYF